MSQIYYFAYGHHLARREMEAHAPGHQVYGLAYLPNAQLHFRAGHSTQTIPTTASFDLVEGQRLYGLLYQLRPHDLEQLDALETVDVQAGVSKPPYRRELTTVYVPGIQATCQAWMYVPCHLVQAQSPSPAYAYKVFSAARIIPGYQPKELARLEALLLELRPGLCSKETRERNE